MNDTIDHIGANIEAHQFGTEPEPEWYKALLLAKHISADPNGTKVTILRKGIFGLCAKTGDWILLIAGARIDIMPDNAFQKLYVKMPNARVHIR